MRTRRPNIPLHKASQNWHVRGTWQLMRRDVITGRKKHLWITWWCANKGRLRAGWGEHSRRVGDNYIEVLAGFIQKCRCDPLGGGNHWRVNSGTGWSDLQFREIAAAVTWGMDQVEAKPETKGPPRRCHNWTGRNNGAWIVVVAGEIEWGRQFNVHFQGGTTGCVDAGEEEEDGTEVSCSGGWADSGGAFEWN